IRQERKSFPSANTKYQQKVNGEAPQINSPFHPSLGEFLYDLLPAVFFQDWLEFLEKLFVYFKMPRCLFVTTNEARCRFGLAGGLRIRDFRKHLLVDVNIL